MRAMLRRRFLAATTLPLALREARAQMSPGTKGPLRLGADRSLVESGLARALLSAFASDTGIAIVLVAAPAAMVLEAIKNGEVDVALTNAPEAEEQLARESLVHDRRAIADGEFILVGPVTRTRGRAPPPAHSGTEALMHLHEMAAGAPESILFLSAGDGSGLHLAEQALWRAAQVEPMPPWYAKADGSGPFVSQVRARNAIALVERGAWAASGGAPLGVLVEGDPMLSESVHAMRAFRVTHPAGKIFVAWIAGSRGRAVAASHRGYRAPA